jgi:hypothetical protein
MGRSARGHCISCSGGILRVFGGSRRWIEKMDREDGSSEMNSDLVLAAERGDLSAVERMLEEGATTHPEVSGSAGRG